MRTVNYSEILYGSAALASIQPADIDASIFALLRTFHDRRLQVAWEIHRWPDVCAVEFRHYRDGWEEGKIYEAGDELYDAVTGRYYQALRAAPITPPTTAGIVNKSDWAECAMSYTAVNWVAGTNYVLGDQVYDPVTENFYQVYSAHTSGSTIDLTKMGRLAPFNRYVAYVQTNQTPIGEIFQATNRDPRQTTQMTRLPFWLSSDGAQFQASAPSGVWLLFRRRRESLAGDAWNTDLTYDVGQQVYFTWTAKAFGNFYTALEPCAAGESPLSTPSKWLVVSLPYFLRGYLIQAGYADWLISDGQTDKATIHETFAMSFLELEADKLQRQQQQVQRLTV